MEKSDITTLKYAAGLTTVWDGEERKQYRRVKAAVNKRCPHCGALIAKDYIQCPHCHQEV